MLVKQRLRATLEARRIDRLCWCCALGLPRYYATVQIDSYPVYKKGSEPSKRMKKNKVPANSLDPYIRKRITTLGHDEPALEKRNADLHIRHLMTNRNDVNLVRFFKSDKGPTEMKILEINEAIEEHRALCGDGGDISESGGAPIRKAYGLARTPVRKRLQIWKHARSSIRQFKKFMAVKYGAKVGASLTGAPFLFDHPVPSYRIRKFHAHGLLAEYMTGTNEATHLVRVAGPPLHQLHVSTEHEISEDSVDIGEIEGVLEFFKDLEASKSSGPKTRVDYRHYFRFFRFHPNVNSICGGENALNRPSPKFLHSRYSAHPTSWTTSRKFATATTQGIRPGSQSVLLNLGTSASSETVVQPKGIRESLRLWQEQQNISLGVFGQPSAILTGDTQNFLSQSGETDGFTAINRDDDVEDDDYVGVTSDEPIPDIFQNHVFFRRGDLVELTAGSQPILAIFVRHIAEQSQFYTMRGEWVNGQPGTVVFSIPRFVDADDLNDILPYLPSEAITEERMNLLQPVNVNAPRGAGARVLKKMRLFQQAADDVFRENADRITRLYEIVAPKEASAGRTYKSLKEIAMLVLKKGEVSELTQVMMWAVHRAVRQCQNIAYDPLQQGQNPVYEIYPQQGLGYILQVGEWVRKYQEGVIEESTFRAPFGIKDALETSEREQNPISTFVKKARVAIQQSRQTRPLSPSGCVGPSTTRLDPKANDGESYSEITLQSFDENERIIIHYLDAWVTTSYLNPFTNWASMGPMILRAVGMYEEFELKRELGFTLLQELGIITPWENCAVYKTRNMKIPGHHYGRERTILVRNAFKESTKLVQNDSMVGLRKDWGGMPVFCIDSAETQERDDGVSIEPVDGDPSLQWVHIHVANPSAFFGPSTALGQFVSMMGESVYFPERTYPLLSPKVTHDHFSLANNRPCLTFSAKMTTSGDIIEKAITPGILRNVHYLTPRAVSQGLGLSDGDEKSESVSVLTVGGSMPSGPKDIGLSSKAALTEPRIKMLRRLLELGEAARHRRALAGAADLSSPALEAMSPVVYLCRTATKPSGIRDSNVRQFEGDPIISVERPTAAFALVGQMVCDLMVIAGEIGASWCRERNIPIPYRGILRDPEPDTSPEDFRRDVLDPKIAKHGCADKTDLIRYMKLVGKSHVSAEPVEHFMLGLPAYCKATSPLRRYVDMYTHWQIEAALRHEASTGKSLLGSTDTSYLPFSRPQVEEYAASTLTSERRVLLCRAHSTRHWIVQALFRAFHYGEAPLPETFIVMVTSAGLVADQYHPGLLQNWDVKVFLRPAAEEGGVRMGDVWESKLVAVLTYAKNIILEPIRLMEREKEAGC